MGRVSVPFKIRAYRPEDLPTLHSIDRACFPPGIAFSRLELSFYLKQPGSIARIADGGGKVVGFVVGRVEPDNSGHVVTLDVISNARRANVGTSLMKVLHQEFGKRKVAVSVLEVNAEDEGARQFYEKLEYQYLELLKGYYYGRLNAYRMVRLL